MSYCQNIDRARSRVDQRPSRRVERPRHDRHLGSDRNAAAEQQHIGGRGRRDELHSHASQLRARVQAAASQVHRVALIG